MGKRRIAYVNPTNYNAMKKEVENKLKDQSRQLSKIEDDDNF